MTEAQAHDSRRCPECETYGHILEFDTRSDDAVKSGLERVRARTFECRDQDCNSRWRYFG